MDWLDIAIPAAIIAPFVLIVGPFIMRSVRRAQLIRHGDFSIAKVVSISQTGTTVNQVPEMRLVVDVEQAGGQPRRITFKQLVDLGSMPRAGDSVYIMVDPTHPDRATLAPLQAGMTAPNTSGDGQGPINLADPTTQFIIGMTPGLRERGKLGIANVVSLAATDTTASQVVLDIDSIGQPLRQVTITQILDAAPPAPGDRVYLMVDPKDPNAVAIVPPPNGQKIPRGANRLDPLVLGPQLIAEGDKATGTVLQATQQTLDAPGLAGRGFSKWTLALNVAPVNGKAPYQANLTISLTSPEKAERIAKVGAEVPLRYDPADLQTVSIDSIAMGYADPYAAVIKALTPS